MSRQRGCVQALLLRVANAPFLPGVSSHGADGPGLGAVMRPTRITTLEGDPRTSGTSSDEDEPACSRVRGEQGPHFGLVWTERRRRLPLEVPRLGPLTPTPLLRQQRDGAAGDWGEIAATSPKAPLCFYPSSSPQPAPSHTPAEASKAGVALAPREVVHGSTPWRPWGRSHGLQGTTLAAGLPGGCGAGIAREAVPGCTAPLGPRQSSRWTWGGLWAQEQRRGKRGSPAPAPTHFEFPQVDAEEALAALEAEAERRDRKGLSAKEKALVNKFLRHFAESGWAADQALAIYINSSFFPTAASKFRKFVLRAITPELKATLVAAGEPSAAANAFLFPLFAEFCFNEFAAEIKAYRSLVNSADMTKPHTWYPYARALKRRVVYHMGPTNSGKTHQALQRFKEASSGLYCGPLRLLAMEVFDRVNAEGVYCNLITGQERKEMPFAKHTACTIEMANLMRPVDVAVVDEIQMMSDEYRGWAWTRAVLGVQAAEVHVCGDPSALQVLQALCEATGDELVCASYSRFAPLTVDQRSLSGSIENVQPGDCIVAFSRRDIFDLKRRVEVLSRQRCSVVYGALPPETRRQQAQLFNQAGSGFDVLVASDAVGMGLNLNIRRIVFSTLSKFNGQAKQPIPAPMVKQISGRAGRRGSLYADGVVTCLHPQDIPQLLHALHEEVAPMDSMGLFPVFEQVELFASQLPEMTFSQLLSRFVETSRVDDGLYFICRTDNILKVASMLDRVPGLSLRDRFHFCFAPAKTRDPTSMATLLQYAQDYASEVPVQLHLPQLPALAQVARATEAALAAGGDAPLSQAAFHLMGLEAQHQVASMYLWLAQHFPEEAFPDRDLATEVAAGAAEQLAAILLKPEDAAQGDAWRARHGQGLELRSRGRKQKVARMEREGAALGLC